MKDFFCHMWFDIFGYGLSDEGLDRKLIVEAHQESSSAVLCILANYTECVRIRHVHMPLKIPWAGSCKEFSGSGSWAEYIREKIMTYIYHRNTWVWGVWSSSSLCMYLLFIEVTTWAYKRCELGECLYFESIGNSVRSVSLIPRDISRIH